MFCSRILWLFLAVPYSGLPCVIVVFPCHIHSMFGSVGKVAYVCLIVIHVACFNSLTYPDLNTISSFISEKTKQKQTWQEN